MKISVIIPTRNRAAWVSESIRSVLAQTRRADEILVVDDGSTDDTISRLSVFGDSIRIFRQSNRGAAAARNQGLALAQHPWVAFLDSDDLWEASKLSRQCEVLNRQPEIGLVYCDSRAVDANGHPLQRRARPLSDGDVVVPLFRHVMVHTPAVLARTGLLRSLGGFDESLRVCEDYDLWLRASLETPFGLVPEPLFVRRVHDGSLAHEDLPEHHDLKCLVLERFAQNPLARVKLPSGLVRRRLARVHFVAARAHLRHGNAGAAREHLGRALKLQPAHPRSWALWFRSRRLEART